MKRRQWMVVLIALCVSLSGALSGCSDDDDDGREPSDAGDVADVIDDVGDATDVTDADDAADVADADDADDADDATDATDTDDTGDVVDDEGFGPGSLVTQFTIAQSGECCRDFDDEDDEDDSAGGDLVLALGDQLDTDYNGLLNNAMEAGSIITLLGYNGWDDVGDDDDLEVAVMFGQDADGDDDFGNNLQGDGTFYVDPVSVDEQGEPLAAFQSASVTDGRLVAEGGTVPIVLAIRDNFYQIDVEDAGLAADVASEANLEEGGTVGLESGELSGHVTVDELMVTLNEVAEDCECIDSATNPVYIEDADGVWECTSTPADQDACAGGHDMCVTLAHNGSCALVASLIADSADLDTDDDDEADALSLGATFQATGASIVDVAPEADDED